MNRAVRIAGTGLYTPEQSMSMAEVSAKLGGINLDMFIERTGIQMKRICPEGKGSAFLATEAAKKALEAANLTPLDIDLLIVPTDTPEQISPATASTVQYELGANNAAVFDINCACNGFVTASDIACKFIQADPQYKNVLVAGTYAMTKYLDWNDPFCVPIFSDGAGAAVYQAFEGEGGFLSSKLIADGQYYDYMGIYCGGSKEPYNAESVAQNRHCVKFFKPFSPTLNTDKWPIIIKDALNRVNLDYQDIDHIIFTQINKSAIVTMMDTLGLPMEKTTCVMDKYGYTGSACIPMALDEAVRNGKIAAGDIVVLCASGGGYSMGAIAFKWA